MIYSLSKQQEQLFAAHLEGCFLYTPLKAFPTIAPRLSDTGLCMSEAHETWCKTSKTKASVDVCSLWLCSLSKHPCLCCLVLVR